VCPEVMELFARCAWPGNLRQLTNVLRTAALMAEGDTAIRREHLPEDFLEECEEAAAPAVAAAPAPTAQPLQAITTAAIAQALVAQGGNVSAVARALGVSRNTVYRHLRAQVPG